MNIDIDIKCDWQFAFKCKYAVTNAMRYSNFCQIKTHTLLHLNLFLIIVCGAGLFRDTTSGFSPLLCEPRKMICMRGNQVHHANEVSPKQRYLVGHLNIYGSRQSPGAPSKACTVSSSVERNGGLPFLVRTILYVERASCTAGRKSIFSLNNLLERVKPIEFFH